MALFYVIHKISRPTDFLTERHECSPNGSNSRKSRFAVAIISQVKKEYFLKGA